MTFIIGKPLYYDDLDEDYDTELFSNEEVSNLESNFLNTLNDDDFKDNDLSYDSYEEEKFHQRGLFSSSRTTHTMPTHTRQAIIDMLQKAFDQGYRFKPSLKHHIPATRFGRHKR